MPMKVAVVVWYLDVKGGTQRQALELSRGLKAHGHDVRLYCARLDRDACYTELLEGLDVTSLHGDGKAPKPTKLRWILHPAEPLWVKEERALARMVGDHDVLNCHDHRAYRVGAVWGRRTGKPVVWMMNDLPASLRKPPTPKDRQSLVRFAHFMGAAGPLGRMADMRRIRSLDAVTVLDRRNQGLLTGNAGIGSTVVRSGLDLGHFRFARRLPRDSRDPFKVFTVGIFFPHRRFEDLVRAIGILAGQGRDVKLRIAGTEAKDPEYAGRIRALAVAQGLKDKVEFLGAISERGLLEEYSKADAFVFPHSPQTWGLAVFEAMACGVPTVATAGCGASEVLTDGVDALVVPAGDHEAIARALLMLMEDSSLRDRLSSEGRRFVEENIRWDLYAEKMAAEFARVISAGEARP